MISQTTRVPAHSQAILHRLLHLAWPCVVLAAAGCLAVAAGRGDGDAASPAAPVAVVELFTSEGCSSCPPADNVLGKIVETSRKDGRRVFALAWHVDYWDRLGWTDPFSSAAATRRQNEYARAFNASGVYTPQMVVNGRTEFTGSNDGKAKAAVDAALSRRSEVGVTLQSLLVRGDRVTAKYELSATPAAANLVVALVERGLSTRVERGENGGRTLRHENVVRSFRVVPLKGADAARGDVELTLPHGVDATKASLIAFVQDGRTMAVAGAAAQDLIAAK